MSLKIRNVPINRWWDIWIAVIAMTLISLVAARIYASEWTSDLEILLYLTFFAGAAGLALGYSRFSLAISALFSTIYGLFTIGWLFGTTSDAALTWRERILNDVGWRLRVAIGNFIAGETFTDPIMFLSIMAILLWILGSSAAFILMREGTVWPAVLPLGFMLLVIGHYDQDLARNSRFLISFLFLTLLLLGRMTFLHYRQNWHHEGIQTTSRTHMDLTKALVILVSALLLTAWIIPVSSEETTRYSDLWNYITQRWERLQDRVSDIFVVDKTSSNQFFGFFSESMNLGTGSPASEETVFIVKAESEGSMEHRNYWQTRSYDYYDSAEWSSSMGMLEYQEFSDTLDIPYPAWEVGYSATYTFTTYVNRSNNLFYTGVPTWVSRPVEALTHPIDESTDLIGLMANPELIAGDTYQIKTQIKTPTVNALRNSGTEYPAWLNTYLQLPDNFSPEITALAAQIAEGRDNPYSISYDITRYLRMNMKYARTIPPVPAGKDPIEWFLFEEKTGFCNYYATAQVLMLRSLGIPSRIAVGYAEGEYDLTTETYTVRRMDSHAWPEVYFVGYGWVVFEPTVDQTALFLPATVQPEVEEMVQLEDLPLNDFPLEEPQTRMDSNLESEPGTISAETEVFSADPEEHKSPWVYLFIFSITLGAIITILLYPAYFKINIKPLPILLERILTALGKAVPTWLRRWSNNSIMSPAEKAYRLMGQSIRLMGHPLNLAETPVERAHTLTNLIPNAKSPAKQIITEYQLQKYSTHTINTEHAKLAAQQILSLTLKARINNIFHFRTSR